MYYYVRSRYQQFRFVHISGTGGWLPLPTITPAHSLEFHAVEKSNRSALDILYVINTYYLI